MRRSILPILLLTTVTLSLSDILPIISVDEADTEPINEDQLYGNTLNTKHKTNKANILYELLVEPNKDEIQKTRLRYTGKKINREDFDSLIEEDDNYDDEGYRKEQWHNYPRQLDRLHKNQQLENADSNFDDSRPIKRIKDATNDDYQHKSKDISYNNDIDDVAVPLLILKIRLAFLTNDFEDMDTSNNEYTDLVPLIQTSAKLQRKDNINANKIHTTVHNKTERQKRIRPKNLDFEHDFDEKKKVNKRIFSLWSRLQSLSHKGHELQHRRHLYAYYGLPDDSSGTLTAETRATLIRPPGSPLRWG